MRTFLLCVQNKIRLLAGGGQKTESASKCHNLGLSLNDGTTLSSRDRRRLSSQLEASIERKCERGTQSCGMQPSGLRHDLSIRQSWHYDTYSPILSSAHRRPTDGFYFGHKERKCAFMRPLCNESQDQCWPRREEGRTGGRRVYRGGSFQSYLQSASPRR